MCQYQASADGSGIAPKGIDSRVCLPSVLETAQSGLIDAGALGHGRQGQPGRQPGLLQLVHQYPNKKIRPALDRSFVSSTCLQVLLSRAVRQFLADGLVPGAVNRAPF